jgi:hypothetical protein
MRSILAYEVKNQVQDIVVQVFEADHGEDC